MRVVNAMFGRALGGIEQSFLDYCIGLRQEGCDIVAITHPSAKINKKLEQHGITPVKIWNFGQFDIVASLKIKKLLDRKKYDVIIAHGNRSFSLINRVKGKVPLVAITHNYKFQRYHKADAAFAITEDLKKAVTAIGQKRVYKIPNMVKLNENEKHEFHDWKQTPVIGILSRFVKKKGIDIFLHAMALLKKENINFHALIAGRGEEENALRNLARKLGLEENVSFPGWISDKEAFFSSIDCFCLPSLHEPFGIVLLEAFSHCVPVVTTDSEGPSEIAENRKDAMIVPKGSPKMLAGAIKNLLNDKKMAKTIAENGYIKVKDNYTMEIVSKKIHNALVEIISNTK